MDHPEKEMRVSKPMAEAILALFTEPNLRQAGLRVEDARRWRTTPAALKKLVALDLAYSPSAGRFLLTDEAVRMAERFHKRKLDSMHDAVGAVESYLGKTPRKLDTATHAGEKVRYAPDPLEAEPVPPRGTLGTIQGSAAFPSGRERAYVDWEPIQMGKRVYRLRSFHPWEDLRFVKT